MKWWKAKLTIWNERFNQLINVYFQAVFLSVSHSFFSLFLANFYALYIITIIKEDSHSFNAIEDIVSRFEILKAKEDYLNIDCQFFYK